MRRTDREIRDRSAIEDVLRRGLVCRLGLLNDNLPYIVPMSYGYENGCLYFHCAGQGLKLDCMRGNFRICFEVEADVRVREAPEACEWTMEYSSVIGYGTIAEVKGSSEKLMALDVLMEHYSGRKGWEVPADQLERTTVLKLTIDEMTGKTARRD